MFVIQREYIADYLKKAPSTVHTESLFRSEENLLAGETLTPLERGSCIEFPRISKKSYIVYLVYFA